MLVTDWTEPGVGGSRRTPSRTEPGSTGWAKVIRNVVAIETRVPMTSVAMTAPVVTARVRKTARAGLASGWPVVASAPAWTVTVWKMPAAHIVLGEMVTMRPVVSQVRSIAVAGSTMIAAATDAGVIAVLNSMVTGSWRSRSVATMVRNAAWVKGTIADGGFATVGDGRLAPMTPPPNTIAKLSPRPIRAMVERRNTAPR